MGVESRRAVIDALDSPHPRQALMRLLTRHWTPRSAALLIHELRMGLGLYPDWPYRDPAAIDLMAVAVSGRRTGDGSPEHRFGQIIVPELQLPDYLEDGLDDDGPPGQLDLLESLDEHSDHPEYPITGNSATTTPSVIALVNFLAAAPNAPSPLLEPAA
ncbi:MAG: hypothetical protein WCF04_06850 [Candidatus Nanopelagicales bacterium]